MLPRVAVPLVLGLCILVVHGGLARAQAVPPVWQPQIAVVWPQDGQGHQTSVVQSRAVNVSVWPTNQVNCNLDPHSWLGGARLFDLWIARNNEPAERLTIVPRLIQRRSGGDLFPSEEYDDTPADIADDRASRYTLVAGLTPIGSNIWVHAADPRTYYPEPVTPVGYATSAAALDTRIQIVWPHDAAGSYAPPDKATFVNIAVDIFAHGTLLSLPPDADLPTTSFLAVAIGNNPVDAVRIPGLHPPAQKTTYVANGRTYPRWVFNDVPVQPGQQYHFLAPAPGSPLNVYSSIWTHAADARTVLPNPQAPPPCVS